MKVQTLTNSHVDHKYLLALVNNDTELIEEIYVKCSAMVTRMVKQNNGSTSDAKDVFQDALICLYKQAQKGFVLTCPLENFVYLICKRKWINSLRKSSIDYRGDFNDILNYEKTAQIDTVKIAEEFVCGEEKQKLFKEKFNHLSPACKEIISLSWKKNDQGKYNSWKNIAEDLDLSYGYVRKKASMCKERLIELVRKDSRYISLKK